MSRKRPKKAREAPKSRQPQTKNRPYLWLHGSNAIPRAPTPPSTPTFCGFHPLELPKRTPRPQYLGPLGCGKLQAQAQTGGCPKRSKGSSRGKKMTFLKNDPRPCATLKQVFLDRLELEVAHFGPRKLPKCLENGLIWHPKWVKNGSKTHFPNRYPRPFGVHKRVKWAHFEPSLGQSGPSQLQKALKVGLVATGFTCKLISLCQEPSMCESFLMSHLTSRHQS